MTEARWTVRIEAAIARACAAPGPEAKLRPYERAGRDSLKALDSVPFMLPRKGPATALGARPIDPAIESDAGLAAVEVALEAAGRNTPPPRCAPSAPVLACPPDTLRSSPPSKHGEERA